jgi:hypothetical protein
MQPRRWRRHTHERQTYGCGVAIHVKFSFARSVSSEDLYWLRQVHAEAFKWCDTRESSRVCVANMASYAISSSLILVILDNMVNGTNHIV